MNVFLVHSQISWPCKFVSTNITRECIAVSMQFHVPPHLCLGSQFLSTYCAFVSDICTVFHVVLRRCLRLETLTAALAMERLVTVIPILVPFQDSLGFESASTVITLVTLFLL